MERKATPRPRPRKPAPIILQVVCRDGTVKSVAEVLEPIGQLSKPEGRRAAKGGAR